MIEKQTLRNQAYDNRNKQKDKGKLSKIICDNFILQQDYCCADTVMWYLHCRSEVRTQNAVKSALNDSKKIVIPYCTKDRTGIKKLGLWWLKDWSELFPGTWGILEPPKPEWKNKQRNVLPGELDLIMVPGVAFGRDGGRLGNGAGYYDRLLKEVRDNTVLTAVCFESQVFDQVTMEAHDIFMDNILTENGMISFNTENTD